LSLVGWNRIPESGGQLSRSAALNTSCTERPLMKKLSQRGIRSQARSDFRRRDRKRGVEGYKVLNTGISLVPFPPNLLSR
jgi:hypothetical protein